ncbi:MAG: hypothetical protein ACK5LJ_08130 [Paracoccus sp. (in: a-proteobacteria)]
MHDFSKLSINNFAVPTHIAETPCDNTAPEYLTMMTNQFGFLRALMNSSATNSIFTVENGRRKYRQVRWNCEDEIEEVVLGKTIWTELPEDIGTACCHTKPDVNGCLTTAVPSRLCLRDCYDDMREHFLRMVRQGYSLFGGSNAESEYMAELKAWFVFIQARDIMYGQKGVTGGNVPSFSGVLDVMNNAMVSFSGADIIGVFEQLDCRLSILGGNYVFGAHPLVVSAVKEAVNRGGQYYRNFSMNGGTLEFKGYPIVEDVLVPVDYATGTGQIWFADLNKAGVFMEYNLSEPDVLEIDSYTDSTTGDCFQHCTMLRNYGFAFSKDFNAVGRITDVPISAACMGENALFGLGAFMNPETLIPTYE